MSSQRQLTISGDFEKLAQIGAFVVQAAEDAGLDGRAVYAMQMAVDEACTNIIEHAYGGEGRGEIDLICNFQKEGLQVIIYDQGKPFDLSQISDLDTTAPLAERNLRGMGWFFIRKLVDTFEFRPNTARGNQLTLFKSKT